MAAYVAFENVGPRALEVANGTCVGLVARVVAHMHSQVVGPRILVIAVWTHVRLVRGPPMMRGVGFQILLRREAGAANAASEKLRQRVSRNVRRQGEQFGGSELA